MIQIRVYKLWVSLQIKQSNYLTLTSFCKRFFKDLIMYPPTYCSTFSSSSESFCEASMSELRVIYSESANIEWTISINVLFNLSNIGISCVSKIKTWLQPSFDKSFDTESCEKLLKGQEKSLLYIVNVTLIKTIQDVLCETVSLPLSVVSRCDLVVVASVRR